jgi:hypothetical protein
MEKMADAKPDPVTGKNRAISMALKVRFAQVFIKHPESVVSQGTPASKASAAVGQD